MSSLLLQVFFVLLYLALVWWTYQDAKRRIREPAFIAGAVALSLLIPYLGAIIYLIVRPPEYLVEARERELELLALEQRLSPDDAEGRALVGRLLEREGGSELNSGAFERALEGANVVRTGELQRLEERIRELEFRLRVGRADPTEDTASTGVVRRRRRSESDDLR